MIKKGRRYRCIREVRMNGHSDDIRYIKGKIYKSEIDGCITDETGVKQHIWHDIKNTFQLIGNKRKDYEDNRNS